jgi:hypothetical protein
MFDADQLFKDLSRARTPGTVVGAMMMNAFNKDALLVGCIDQRQESKRVLEPRIGLDEHAIQTITGRS